MKVKAQKVNIPQPLTDADKADLAEVLLDLRSDKQDLEEAKQEFIKKHRDEVADIENKIDYQFKVLKNGNKMMEVKARIRKNFDAEPPAVEYVDPKDDDKVLHTVPMERDDYQLETGEWVVGEVKPVPEAETLGDDDDKVDNLDEQDLDGE